MPSPSRPTPYLSPDVVHEAQVRLSRLAGHVRAVGRMLAEGRDCTDVLIQLEAVRAGLMQVAVRLMQAHAETCLSMVHTPEDQQRALERLEAALAAALGERRRTRRTVSRTFSAF